MEPTSFHSAAIGLMSGTSCDGLDLAYCRFYKNGLQWQYRIEAAETLTYPEELLKQLQTADRMNGKDLMQLDRGFGKFCGEAVSQFLHAHQLPVPSVVGSHGHTVFHAPSEGMTCQIGSGAALYAACGIPVACDFRSIDVALGGQGAPLVPLGDRLLFSTYDYCLNMGGISNVSYNKDSQVIAFDISPVNMTLNYLAGLAGKPYDENGNMAASGHVNQELLNTLNALDYYRLPAPKSLGKEWFNQAFFPALEKFAHLSVNDQLATCTEHIAWQMAESIKATSPQKAKLLATGGGAFNAFLMQRFSHYLKHEVDVHIPDARTIAFKEALIFALLGVLRMENENNVLSSATGSRRDHCGGALYGI